MNMGIDVLDILRISRIYVSRDIEIAFIFLFYLVIRNKAGILWIRCDLLIKCRDDSIDIAFTQTILVTILNISTAGIDHEDTLPVGSPLFVDYQHACRNTGSVEKVCRKTYDALDPVFLDNRLSD